MASRLAANEAIRNLVTQPVSRPSEDADVVGCQPHFLVELSVHRLLRRFPVFDSSLRELP